MPDRSLLTFLGFGNAPLRRRPTLLPLARDKSGNIVMAMPSLLKGALESIEAIASDPTLINRPEIGRHVVDASALLAGPAAVGVALTPRSALGALGAARALRVARPTTRQSLPMDRASRLARARAMGFDDTPFNSHMPEPVGFEGLVLTTNANSHVNMMGMVRDPNKLSQRIHLFLRDTVSIKKQYHVILALASRKQKANLVE